MSAVPSGRFDLPAEDLLRAHIYAFLARLLGAPPDEGTLQALRGLGRDETSLGRALGALADAAEPIDVAAAEAEYAALFIGLTQGEVIRLKYYTGRQFTFGIAMDL